VLERNGLKEVSGLLEYPTRVKPPKWS